MTLHDVYGDNGEIIAEVEDPETGPLEHVSALARRVGERLRAEWPGPRTTARGEFHIYPAVRPGGGTEMLIQMAERIIAEEEAK